MLRILTKGVRRRADALLLVGALVVLAPPALATSDLELVQLIATGHIEEARVRFSTLAPTEIDWLFFDGRVAKAEAKFDQAILMFRDVLRRDPSYTAARRELAHSLLLIEDYRASAYHFRDLLRTDPEIGQRRGYVHFLDEIDRLRPFSLSGSLSIVSSSNLNRGSSRDTFYPGVPDTPSFDITSQAEPGTGLELSVAGRHLWRRANGYRWAFDWGLSGRKFDKSVHDSATLATELRFGRLTERAQWSVGPFLQGSWRADGDDSTTVGIGGNVDWRLNAKTTLFLSGSAAHRDYLSEDIFDGPLVSAQFGFARSVGGGVLSLGTSVTLSRPEQEHQQNDRWAVFAYFARAWSGGLQGGLGLEVGRRDYAAEFALAGVAREDTFHRVTISIEHDAIRFGRFVPVVECAFSTTSSNVAFYDHDVEECSIGVRTRF